MAGATRRAHGAGSRRGCDGAPRRPAGARDGSWSDGRGSPRPRPGGRRDGGGALDAGPAPPGAEPTTAKRRLDCRCPRDAPDISRPLQCDGATVQVFRRAWRRRGVALPASLPPSVGRARPRRRRPRLVRRAGRGHASLPRVRRPWHRAGTRRPRVHGPPLRVDGRARGTGARHRGESLPAPHGPFPRGDHDRRGNGPPPARGLPRPAPGGPQRRRVRAGPRVRVGARAGHLPG